MEVAEVKGRLTELFANASHIGVQGEDCSFGVIVVTDDFAEVRPVQRQQKILAAFSSELGSGALHALTVEAYTPQEWESKSSLTAIQM